MIERYLRLPLKFKTPYGKSGHKRAFRVHLWDLEACYVKSFPGLPNFTRYRLRWYCGNFSDSHPPIFLKGPFEETEICTRCQNQRDYRAWLRGLGYDPIKLSQLSPREHQTLYSRWLESRQGPAPF